MIVPGGTRIGVRAEQLFARTPSFEQTVGKGMTIMETFELTSEYGKKYELPYMEENGFGKLWLVVNSMGPIAIIRAESQEKAYQCWIDELAPDPIDDDICEDGPDWKELIEGYEYRASGVPSNPKLSSQIASIDLNGLAVRDLWHDIVYSGYNWRVPPRTVFDTED